MIVVKLGVAFLWLMFGAYLLATGRVIIGKVKPCPMPDKIAEPIMCVVALIIGPPMWIYAVLKEQAW